MPAPPPPLRHALSGVPRYRPGRAFADALPPGVRPYSLASNENPRSPVAPVAEAVARASAEANRYPDMFARGTVGRVAAHLGVDPARVVVGPGSVGVLSQVVTAACAPGDEVVSAWRSFEAYPVLAGVAGCRHVGVPLTADGRHDLPALAAAVTGRTRVVLLCSPNNPTGPVLRHGEVAALLRAVPPEIVVALDEAYVEFVRDPGAVDALALAEEHANLVVLRTFSKAHGLASLRVGYAVAHPEVADGLRAVALPFAVSAAAQAGAVAALDALDLVMAGVDEVVRERERVVAALAGQGWSLPAADGNFVWFGLGARADELVAACAARGVAVRGFTGEGVRVSIGEPEANDVVLDVAGGPGWAGERDGHSAVSAAERGGRGPAGGR